MNNLTRFDQGGTHESSPIGGIPQGQAPNGSQNMVEQGESKMGNFVYSNRIALDGSLVKQFNLPPYIKGKTVADASKAIDDKFKDRADKYAQETKKTLLDRLAQAQEHLKQQEQAQQEQINQSMQANAQAPSGLPDEVPPGMEEFAGGEPSAEQESQEQAQMNPASPIAAFGGYQIKRYDVGGYIQGDNNLDGVVDAADNVDKFGNAVKSGGAGASGMPSAGSMANMGMTALNLGNLAFGKAAQDTSGQAASGKVNAANMIGSSALQGVQAGAAFGAPGMLIGGAIGAGAGALGVGKARKAEMLNTQRFAANTNRALSDNYAAYGGQLQYGGGGGLTGADRGSSDNPYPTVDAGDFAGGGRSYPIPTRADAVDALRLAGLHGRSDVRAKVYAKYPDLKHAMGGYITSKPSHYADGGYYDVNKPAGSLDYGQPNPLVPQPQDNWYSKNPALPTRVNVGPDGKPSVPTNWYDKNKPLFVDPTQGPVNLPQGSSTLSKAGAQLGKASKVAGKAIGENFGEALRFAPLAMNAYQLATLGKPQGVNYATSAARFKPSYVDEAHLQNIVDQSANNQIAALQQSGASEGAIRAATLSAGLNRTKALSDAYANAAAQNRATDVQAQQFNYAVDQSNIATRNKAIDEMRMDDAARRSAKSKLLATMGTDVGNIGKEIADAQLAGALTGYSRRGKYLYKPDGTKVSPEELANITNLYKKQDTTTTTPATVTPKAMGGYMNPFKTRK